MNGRKRRVRPVDLQPVVNIIKSGRRPINIIRREKDRAVGMMDCSKVKVALYNTPVIHCLGVVDAMKFRLLTIFPHLSQRLQVYHVCALNKKFSFLCPNGTIFDQRVFVCNWWYNVDCAASPNYYNLNDQIGVAPPPPSNNLFQQSLLSNGNPFGLPEGPRSPQPVTGQSLKLSTSSAY